MQEAGTVPEQQRNSPEIPLEQSGNAAESVQPVLPKQEIDLFDEFSESSELVASQGFEAIGCNEFKRRYGINNHQFYELKDDLGVKDTSCGLSPTLHKAFKRMAEKRGWLKEAEGEAFYEASEMSTEPHGDAENGEPGELATIQSETLNVQAAAPTPFVVENLTINIQQPDTQRIDSESDRLYSFTKSGIQDLTNLISSELLTEVQNVRAINRNIAAGVQAAAVSNVLKTVGNANDPAAGSNGSNGSAGSLQ